VFIITAVERDGLQSEHAVENSCRLIQGSGRPERATLEQEHSNENAGRRKGEEERIQRVY
jgi:hypothetical protein